MKKIFLIFALTILFFNKSYAATGEGVASEYIVTMKKLELCEDSACATSTTVGDSSMPVDIASVSAGADCWYLCGNHWITFRNNFFSS